MYSGKLYLTPGAVNDRFLSYHLLYRDYRFSFHNRLAVSVGGYWQQDFGIDPTAALRYEHVWEYSPRFFLLYGVSLARHSYDGDGENQLGCHLELNWRF
ncbi:hypothetical protein [Syntrophotalea sp.]|uniref:hypothetical protein n=1 Tax=Syntrophotalea sp. TaxID=2812029 RepID=UPI003D0A9E01